jgi:rhodanese-related sulfurtransferase
MGLLDFFKSNSTDYIADFKSRNAVIVDVRTPGEFRQGAIKGSKNIPLQELNNHLVELKKLNRPVITCCASGMRSGSAASILKRNGIEVVNGGGWMSLEQRL